MRLLLDQGADPMVVHHAEYRREDGPPLRERTTALMAAVGIGGGAAWVQPERAEREALMLDTVKLALDLGIDVNAANIDGRTALDAAKAARLDSVVKLLADKGGKLGTPTAQKSR